jgi:UDP-arabinose 4-epimerase
VVSNRDLSRVGMNILVTGGAGYIGSHAAKALARAGHRPIVYDNLSRGHDWAVQWGPLVKGDTSHTDLIAQTLRTHQVDAVLHFAAFAYVGESMSDPGAYFTNNFVGSMRLLEAMRSSGVRDIVFSSTCAVYGNPQRVPITEDEPRCPVNPYGESKLMVEKLLRWYGEIHGMRWVALRYFNAAGADPEGETGECHDPEPHVIPLALEAAESPARPLAILGTDYPTPDGTAVRDYTHVADLAQAHLRALDYIGAGGESRAFNLGTGRGHSVREVIAAVRSVTGAQPATREAPRRAGDPPVLVADPSAARAALGWSAQLDLHDSVRTAWNWRVSRRARNPASAHPAHPLFQ